ncbi:hypothetical protein JOD54_003671 [Actinokineospora baliensis]|uniref:hypothetical protein n=1 Tax=Actinokineospora baliensis TaxID=547056 RepID=UPI00195ED4A5|nr:hypothetical protein [Actinokineospora baliensis]MBM7773467.1 hypothetical protein [Actinokineospora baliensis]
MRENVYEGTADRIAGSDYPRPVSDPVIVDRADAAEALLRFFLANADANDHDANDHLVEQLCRRLRETPPVPAPLVPLVECD